MATERLIGNKPNQVPLNGMLGRMAYEDPAALPPIFSKELRSAALKLSRDGGKTFTGEALYEVSSNPKLKASTGITDNNTVPTQTAILAYLSSITRWGESSYGKRDVGIPGDYDFSIADPPLYPFQLEFVYFPLVARIVDLEQKMQVLWDAYLREVALRQIGLTIGSAGLINFGVGPAVNSGAPVPVGSEQDYYPIHAASNSFM